MDLIRILANILVAGIVLVSVTYGLMLIAPYVAIAIVGGVVLWFTLGKQPTDIDQSKKPPE